VARLALRPTHLVYPSAAAFLARLVLDAGLRAPGPRVVIANAEPVAAGQRALIEEAFACPLRDLRDGGDGGQ
jgi:phenylacetate-coenzyme A ligase PaaK-like adenylate-forming protein